MNYREQAQALRWRLNDPAVDIESLAQEAAMLFAVAAGPAQRRWLSLELQGYGSAVEHAPLHQVLGVDPGDRLESHVSAYRSQEGQILEPLLRAGQIVRHFFVESIHDLTLAAQRVRSSTASDLHLSFCSGVPDYPTDATFPVGVFERVLLGFRAELHHQLGSIGT